MSAKNTQENQAAKNVAISQIADDAKNMDVKNDDAKGADDAKNVTLSQRDEKIILATSANFVAKRLTAIPQRLVSFDKLTQKQKIDYFTDCAIKGILPNVTGEVVLNVKGLYSIDYFKAFTSLIRKYTDDDLLKLYGEVFTKRDATSTESRVIRQYLETGAIVYPNLADKTAVIVTEEQEQDESGEGDTE